MITVKSNQEKYQMDVSNSKVTVKGDIPADRGGGGEYMSPTEMLASSLGMCLNVTARFILEKRNIAYKEITTKVDIEDLVGESTTFKYHVAIDADISEEDKVKYIKMAFAGCHVHKLLEQKLVFAAME
jgi:putative redox protein